MATVSPSPFDRLPESCSTPSADTSAAPGDRTRRPADQWFEQSYDDLYRVARRLRRRENGVASTHSLVHEAYLRVARTPPQSCESQHLRAVAISAMRQVRIDHWRRRHAAKRRAESESVAFDPRHVACKRGEATVSRCQLAQSLRHLARTDRRMAEVVVLRWVRGLTTAQAAARIGVSERTVRRTCRNARRLLRELCEDDSR